LTNQFTNNEDKVDIFIHNSAITKSRKNYKIDLFKTNIRLTKKALLLAKQLKTKKFFFISSTSVYRNFDKPKYNERSATSSKEPYSASKLAGEKICREFCKKNNIKFGIFRLGNIYTGFERTKWSRANVSLMQQWLNNFDNNILLSTNSFDTLRDWTYLNDIPHAIHSIIKHENNFKILNLVSPYVYKDFDIMKKISKNIKLLKSLKKEVRHNATYSIYTKKIKFKNWTSPQRGINLIRGLNEKN
jgi:nucleoside-diphosphate-sugar epimerase